MSKQIFHGEAILNNEVVIATVDKKDLYTESPGGRTAVEFEISFKEPAHNVIRHSKSVTFGHIVLAGPHVPKEPSDLGLKLVQFHESLPSEYSDSSIDLFVYPSWNRSELLYRVGVLIRAYFKARPKTNLKFAIIHNSLPITPADVSTSMAFYTQNQVLKGYPGQDDKIFLAENGWHSTLNRNLSDLSHSMQSSQDYGKQEYIPSDAEIEASHTIDSSTTADLPNDQATTIGTCQVVMSNNKVCNSDLSPTSTTNCILHEQSSEKSKELFEDAVQAIFQTGDSVDLTHTVFPSVFTLSRYSLQGRDLICINSVFHGPVHLGHIESADKTVFDGSKFHSDVQWLHSTAQYASFKNCNFLGDVRIVGGTVQRGLDFEGSTFHGSLYVNDTTGGGNMFSYIDAVFKEGFNHRSYSGKASKTNLLILRRAVFENPNSAYLYDTELLRLSLSGCDVKGINIINCGLGPSDNPGQIYDETQLGEEYFDPSVRYTPSSVVESYQQLQVTMLKSKNYEVAGVLYKREMDLRRSLRTPLMKRIGKEAWYRRFAFYGESYWRPIGILFAIFLILPAVQMFCMGDAYFEWRKGFLDFVGYCIGVWGKEVVNNLKAVVYFGSDPFKDGGIYADKIKPHLAWNLVIIAEKLIVAILGSFIVIALRRKFKRY